MDVPASLPLALLCATACVGSRVELAVRAPRPASPASTLEARTIEVGDRERSFLFAVPERCRGGEPVPLVLVLHRRGGSAAQAARDYGMHELADAAGFVVAFPETSAPWGWSAGGLPLGDGAADLAFLEAVLDVLTRDLSIDASRVFCCGHSSGGIMAYELARKAPQRLAAIGVVAGSIGLRARRDTVLTAGPPVSVVHVHGTADTQVAYDSERAAGLDLFVSAPDSVAAWAARNGCAEPVRVDAGHGTLRIERHAGGRDGAEVVLHTLVGGAHAWPRSTDGNRGFDAAVVLWEFFVAHPRR